MKLRLIIFIFLGLLSYNFLKINKQQLASSRDNQLVVKFKNYQELYKFKFNQGVDVHNISTDYKLNQQVEIAEPNYLYYSSFEPQDPYYDKQWYLPEIKAPEAWNISNGSGVVVAVLDSGVDINNLDLVNNTWINTREIPNDNIDNDKNGYIDDIYGWDFVSNTNNVHPVFDDKHTSTGINHGTTVAGVVAAEGNNKQGVTGVAWKSKIMPLRVLNNEGNGDTLAVARAIDYAVANGAHIINMSFVGVGYSNTIFTSIKNAYNNNVVLVAAAGNKSKEYFLNLDEVLLYPICYDVGESVNRIVGVTGLDALDQKPVSFNFGQRCVDVSAPGSSFFGLQVYSPQHGYEEYQGGFWSGTSIATGVVSGEAALIKSFRPGLSAKQITEIIINTTDSIDAKNPGFINKLGSGKINLYTALNLASIVSGEVSFHVTNNNINIVPPTLLPNNSSVTSPKASGSVKFRVDKQTLAEFGRIYGRLPNSFEDWRDYTYIQIGLKPLQRNLRAEQKGINDFKIVFKRTPNSKSDWLAVDRIVYGLKPATRSLNKEAQAVTVFRKVFKKTPNSEYGWNIVRAIAYK